MIFNWLLIAGLPIDPSPAVPAARAAAGACRAKWANRANDQRKGPYYRTLLDQVDDMEAALSEETEIDRLAKEARAIAFPPIDASLLIAAGKGRSVPREKLEAVARIAAKRIERQTGIKDVSLSEDLLKRRAAKNGISVGEGAAADRARRAYEELGKPNPAQDAAFKVDVQLALYGAADLYEFACPPGCADPRSAVGDDLVRRADELAGSFKQDKERKSTIDTLAQKAKEVFGSREKRQRYDAYLRRRAVAAALDELKDCATLSGGVVDEQLAAQTENALRRVLGKDAAEAPYVLEGFCRAQRPPLAILRETGAAGTHGAAAAGAAGAPGASGASNAAAAGTAKASVAAPTGAGGAAGASATGTRPASNAAAGASRSPRSASAGAPGGLPAKCDPVVIEGATVANGDLVVRVTPPAAATGFVVMTRPDRFVRSMSDTNPAGLQTRHEVPRALLDRDGALVVPDARRLGCYVTVFAEYRANGKVKYSKGVDCQVAPVRARGIRYRVDARKLPFCPPKAQVTFAPRGGACSLPESLVVYAKGSLPLTAEGARVAARIPAQQVTGPFRVDLDGLPNERDLYVRVFAASGDAEAFALEPGSYCKVS